MTSRQVILTYRTMAGLYTLAASLIWGVNTLFLLDAGLDILGVFIANATFTASMAVFEIPTGVVADTVGRRPSFLLSIVIVLTGTLGYVGVSAAGGGLVLFCAMSVLLGLGYAFYSVAMEAWLVDALRATGFDGQPDRVFARSSMVSGTAMLFGTVGGGLLASVDLAWPFRTPADRFQHSVPHDARPRFPPSTPQPLGISRGDAPRHQDERSLWLAKSVGAVADDYLVLSVGLLSWGFYAWQPYFLDLLGSNAAWVA